MAKQIVWTKTAARQRRQVLQYWLEKNKSPEYPKKLIKLIAQRTLLLVQFPKSGKLTSFQEVRVSALGHYSLLYKIERSKIIIVGFWDNRQDPKKLLRMLKNK